jgi:poly-beta-1,6-N-acetyl-D-glucosamine synthase
MVITLSHLHPLQLFLTTLLKVLTGLETYIQVTLYVLFLLCFIIQLYFPVANHRSLATYATDEDLPETKLPISVIISARNEAQNLTQNLESILTQKYPDFEVVVVNDCSFDNSDVVLEEFKKSYTNLKVVTITEHTRFKTGKKFALTLGIKAASNEHLLFTDADCQPATPSWITRMAAKFTGDTQIVLGYSPYYKSNNFLNGLIRFETLKTAINYLSAALNGDAYMGIGRNLAYTKTLFFGAKGFASHMHVISGDDDLFVNQNATAINTAIEIHPDTFVFTSAKNTIASLFRQKTRHMGVGKLYKARHRKKLSIDALSGLLFYSLLIGCLCWRFEAYAVLLILFVLRWIIQLIIYRKIFKKLGEARFLWYLPFFDYVYYVYINLFGLIGTFRRTRQWK